MLVGGKADANLVRPGAEEARVDGRFLLGDEELVISRVLPRSGRSRAYINGRPASAGELAELGQRLVDLHGQHAHQSLLHSSAQRDALDRYAGTDLGALALARRAAAELERRLAELGGDERSRAREADLLRFQLAELEAAELRDPLEGEALDREEDLLADAVAHQDAAEAVHEAIQGEGGALDRLAVAAGLLRDRGPFVDLATRLRGLTAELEDVAVDLRGLAEAIEPNPQRLAEVRTRRQLIRDLCRKYGETLADVIVEEQTMAARLAELDSHEERAAALGQDLAAAQGALRKEQNLVGATRRSAADGLARLVEANLRELAMPRARVGVKVGDIDPGDDVTFELAANPGAPLLALAKVASGGELARAMLALRLVLLDATKGAETAGPTTLVFDEVDAGIGGAAATAVGRALASLGADRQVLVVTHLAQVAAWADAQIAVAKAQADDDTVSLVARLDDDARVVELARMLSGSPGSKSARVHAAELLAVTGRGTR